MLQLSELDEACNLESWGAKEHMTVADRRAIFAPQPYKKIERIVAEVDGKIAGRGVCTMPLTENKDTAFLVLVVDPEFRGRGIGTALADRLKEIAQENGRTVLDTWGGARTGSDTDDPTLPWNKLAAYLGMRKKNYAFQKVLRLPLAPGKLYSFEAKVAEKIAGYRLET